MSNIIDFDEVRVRKYLIDALYSFKRNCPDSEYQRGYLAALCAVYREALNGGSDELLVFCRTLAELSDE